ncbi:MAG TPA: hypothetical protein PKE30_06685 [Niabella sp.]|nr:hypothetical protein [Niabella sp.]
MKRIFIAAALLCCVSASFSQNERSPFRRGYLRLGLNNLPGKIDHNLSPKQNILASNYGSGTGFVLEMGKAYYFNRPQSEDLIGYGLDWTVFSLTYNPLKKWGAYENDKGDAGATSDPLVASLSTRLGPVVSFKPVEKLIIDARVQLAVSAYHFNYEYAGSSEYLFLQNGYKDEDDSNALGIVTLGFKPSFGFSVRRGIIGLALDYAPGKTKMNYEEGTGNYEDGYTYNKANISTSNLQLKLNLSF